MTLVARPTSFRGIPVAKQKKQAKPVKPRVMALDLDAIDTSPARAVRSGTDQSVIEKYKLRYGDDLPMPDIDVFSGPTKNYLGDGLHRVIGKTEAMGQTINALVRKYKTDEEALAAAQDHAAGANEEHGYARTAADKRAAVRSVIGLARHSEASDNEIGKLCKVGHVLVRLVREELTAAGQLKGKASAKERHYDPNAKLRAGVVSDGKGGTKPIDVGQILQDMGVGFTREPGRATNPEPPTEGHLPAGPVSMPAERPVRTPVRDSRGRVVPESLADAFTAGKAFVSDVRGTLSEVFDAIQAASSEPWGRELAGTIQAVEIDFKNVREAIRCGVPSVVCPHIGDDGEHDQSGKCRVCGLKGWIARGTFEQLTDDLKAMCDERAAGGTPETEAA